MITPSDFAKKDWPEQCRILREIDNMASNCEGKTQRIANDKRKPYLEHYDILKKIHDDQWETWINKRALT